MKFALQGLILSLLIAAAAVAQQSAPTFVLRLPSDIRPETAMAHYGGIGYASDRLSFQRNTWDYRIIPNKVSSTGTEKTLKLLLYVPGYRVLAKSFREAELAKLQIFAPTLEPLRTTRWTGRLAGTNGQPRAREKLSLSYYFPEDLRFFDCIDCFISTIPIADFETDAAGNFAVDVPAFGDDPFFDSGSFVIVKAGEFASPIGSKSLAPSVLPLREFPERLLLTETIPGTLSGKIEQSYFLQHKLKAERLPEKSYPNALNAQILATVGTEEDGGFRGYSDLVRGDGSFELSLAPGQYDIYVVVGDKAPLGMGERVLIQKGYVIQEGRRETLNLR